MTIEDLKAGLEILIREGASGCCVSAEHDVLYAGPEDAESVSAKARAELEALGWFVDSETGSWAAFT